jgi:hypothetical protein
MAAIILILATIHISNVENFIIIITLELGPLAVV